MRIKVGVMGSAEDVTSNTDLQVTSLALGAAIAKQNVILLTGSTTGVVYLVGKAAHDGGALHVGVSPASCKSEHLERYKLPTDACDLLVYTGFGLKGRNVVLVRSCDVVLFIAGAMGSLNEFTIAYDEGKVIGCLRGTGGVADESEYLLERFSKPKGARIYRHDDPDELLALCLNELG